MEDDVEVKGIVIDNGSFHIMSGFIGNDTAHITIRNVVASKKNANNDFHYEWNYSVEYLIKNGFEIVYPIEKGIITNWKAMEKIWHHVFYTELKVDPKEYFVLMTEPPLNPKASRERTIQILFEKIETKAVSLQLSSVFPLYAVGRNTGVLVKIGHQISSVIPIVNSQAIPHLMQTVNISGTDITNLLLSFLYKKEAFKENNIDLDFEFAQKIKENVCFVAQDFENKLLIGAKVVEKFNISVQNERFICPEILFKPYSAGKEGPGIHEAAFTAIDGCDENIRSELYQNIVLDGSSSTFPGFSLRLKKEIEKLTSKKLKLKLIATPFSERRHSTFIGASYIASLSEFQSNWITRSEYKSIGAHVLLSKERSADISKYFVDST